MNVNGAPDVGWAPPTKRKAFWWAMPTLLVCPSVDVMRGVGRTKRSAVPARLQCRSIVASLLDPAYSNCMTSIVSRTTTLYGGKSARGLTACGLLRFAVSTDWRPVTCWGVEYSVSQRQSAKQGSFCQTGKIAARWISPRRAVAAGFGRNSG